MNSNSMPAPAPACHRFARLTFTLLLLVSAATSPSRAVGSPATSRPDVERRVSALLSRMTLDEKLGQLQQLDGTAEGDFRPEHVELVRKGLLGSTINVRGADRTTALQRVAMQESRLKIPLLFAFDVIHGYRTVFPVPLAEAATWDPACAEESSSIAAAEASSAGVRWTFAPMVDIARDPRWGRIVEGSGEDPFLGAAMARARVRGFQGSDFSCPDKVVACAKHWVAYGAAEGGRDYNTTDLSDRTLREIYFPPFKAALDAGVGTFMSAFNDLNGLPTTAHPGTLTGVLRHEWGFDGVVVSDYTAVKELIAHGLAADDKAAAVYALNAGVDMEMVSRTYNDYGRTLLQQGRVARRTIDEAVRRVLRLKFRLGLFDHPYADPNREATTVYRDEHRNAARCAAARSFVLLKNDNHTLPISRQIRSLAVVGPLADDPLSMMGPWWGDGRKDEVITLLAALRARCGTSTRVTCVKGCDVTGDASDNVAEAARVAAESDFVVVAVGETADMSGEAAVRSSLDLPGRQLALVQAIHATGKPYAVVLMNGRPLSINWVADHSPAILETWFSGTEGGRAIADTLFGDANPGGKLPVTFPRSVGQVPLYYNHKNTGRPPDAANKYTSKYLDLPWTPLYPFGYGLSYSRFRISDLQLSALRVPPRGTLTATVQVTNVSSREGDEVVQLYLRHVTASVTRPVKELKGFQRVTLQPGQIQKLTFTLGPAELGFYDRQMKFVVEPGLVTVFVGSHSQDILQTGFEIGR